MTSVTIIEDHAGQGLVFKMAMEQLKMDVKLIQNGAVARDRLKEYVPDIILLDLHLPGVDGEQILRELRADSRYDNTRIVLTTADALLAEKLKPMANLVLLKPIGFQQLQELVTKIEKTLNGEAVEE
jgi:CheY-like chemotaxis protein